MKKKIPAGKTPVKKVTAVPKKKAKVTKQTDEEPVSAVLFQPDLLKRDLVRQTIITILWKKEEVTPATLVIELNKEIGHHFDGDIEQYVKKVMIDLVNWKLMEETPGKKALHYRLAQKLDKREEE